jgi:hypothetical protein
MGIVVIGGHSRNIGKTSVVCALISALRERHWTAIKVTHFDHELHATRRGESPEEIAHRTAGIWEERDPSTGTDSSRYLAAGAMRSLWVRAREGELVEAMPRIRAEIARGNLIIESNSVLGFLKPDVYACVIDPEVGDFKRSAMQYLGLADALLVPANSTTEPAWKGVSLKDMARIPRFPIAPPDYSSSDFAAFVVRKLAQESISR